MVPIPTCQSADVGEATLHAGISAFNNAAAAAEEDEDAGGAADKVAEREHGKE